MTALRGTRKKKSTPAKKAVRPRPGVRPASSGTSSRVKARISQPAVPLLSAVHAANDPSSRRLRHTEALTLPQSWFSPPKKLLTQVHTPPALVHWFKGDLQAEHQPLTYAGMTHSDDGDVFVMLILPRLLSPSSQASSTPEAAHTSPCSRSLATRLTQALKAIRLELGSVDPIASDVLVIAMLARAGRLSAGKSLSLRDNQWEVAGLALAHELQQATRVHRQTLRTGSVLVGDVWCTGTSLCGVQLMWVAEAWRGRGVAFAMVEQARRHVCYGHCIDASLVAFSEPTELGCRFARRYAGRDDFLIY